MIIRLTGCPGSCRAPNKFGDCPHCLGRYTLRADGTIRAHRIDRWQR